jgi:hypothetical protein
MEAATGWSEETIGYWKLKENHQIGIYGNSLWKRLWICRKAGNRMNVIKF